MIPHELLSEFQASINFAWLASILVFWASVFVGHYLRTRDVTYILFAISAVLGSITFVLSIFFAGAFAIELGDEGTLLELTRWVLSFSLIFFTGSTIEWYRKRAIR